LQETRYNFQINLKLQISIYKLNAKHLIFFED